MLANTCYCGLRNQLKSQLICRKTIIIMYKTFIQTIVLYASEIWMLSKDILNQYKFLKEEYYAKSCAVQENV